MPKEIDPYDLAIERIQKAKLFKREILVVTGARAVTKYTPYGVTYVVESVEPTILICRYLQSRERNLFNKISGQGE